jgi:hypothetical protein
MNRFDARLPLAELALTVLETRHFLTSSSVTVAYHYREASIVLVEIALTHLETWQIELDSRVDKTKSSLEAAVQEISELNTGHLIKTLGCYGAFRYIALKCAETSLLFLSLGRVAIEAQIFGLEFSCSKLVHQSAKLTLIASRTAIDNDRRRLHSLKEILSNPKSPIVTSELLLWLVTRSRHIDIVLGDFRESYETRRAKFGANRAIEWSRDQVVREVWNRVKSTFQIAGVINALLHLIRHSKKN